MQERTEPLSIREWCSVWIHGVQLVVEDVERLNELGQDELWFSIWHQFELLEKLV